jgi:hypothetical protein
MDVSFSCLLDKYVKKETNEFSTAFISQIKNYSNVIIDRKNIARGKIERRKIDSLEYS